MSAAVAALARTRHAIVLQMAPAADPGSRAADAFAGARAAASTWWRYEPARPGLELARALGSRYAGREPWRFLAAAAAGGALLAFAHRSRLLSVTGVLAGLARSSRLPSLLLATLTAVASRRVQAVRAQPLASVPWRNIDAT